MNKDKTTKNNSDLFTDHLQLKNFNKILELKFGGEIGDLLTSVLWKPFIDLTGRRGKKIRGRLVELGFLLSDEKPSIEKIEQCKKLMVAIEYLHAGSLAVDDVQDGSQTRRGEPSLHLKYGLPIALNIGNWLYFLPLEIIRDLNLNPLQELELFHVYHRTLTRAHMGQAMDIGLPVDVLPQDRVYPVCLASMELKSGALFSLALALGAILGGVNENQLQALDRFGHGFGIGLQMFDDIGNLKGAADPIKKWEDLLLRRPTFVWACAAKYYSKEIYEQFILAIHQLPHDSHPLLIWLNQHHFIEKAKQLAHEHMKNCFQVFEKECGQNSSYKLIYPKLTELALEVSQAYE
ncbi:MAG: polyprenyl synthetase family protein [Elusimicrobiota bacterium]